MSENSDRIYDDLMLVVLKEWEAFTPNPEIAEGVERFYQQMNRWVEMQLEFRSLVEKAKRRGIKTTGTDIDIETGKRAGPD